ncbi:unnamed protein product [Durusdinium trenchii]|uniref:CHASE domain-containing protein n=2 Tax=Durusdinium trenchii TaxID=1381693 RepID=A0ABP0JKI6_9DINO
MPRSGSICGNRSWTSLRLTRVLLGVSLEFRAEGDWCGRPIKRDEGGGAPGAELGELRPGPGGDDEDRRCGHRFGELRQPGGGSDQYLPGHFQPPLAPFGRLDCIYPLVDETQDNRAALGLNLLLDPVRSPAALDSIVKQETAVIGPVKLLQGGVALIARRPIFTRFAPALMPDAWYQTGGHNYSRVCSKTPPDEHCSFLGPPEADGTPTYFWGFATMLGRVEELLSPIHLERLQSGAHRLSGLTSFHYLLTDTRADPPVEYYGRSDREAALDRPVEAMVVVEEANIRWLLQVAPRDGWPVVFADFWNQLFIVVPMTALLGVGLGVNIIIAMRKRAHQIIKLEEYRREVISRTILASISNLNLLQFPMCLLKLQDFLGLGRLIRHEDAREARKLCFIDQPQVAADLCKEEGVAFISHQWAGFEHPDPEGIQYRSMVVAVKEVISRGLKCSWIWVDYSSIPQQNAFQQQTAINSLSVYASYCSVFLSVVPPCKHADSGHDVDIHSYCSRAWCRLEKLSYATCSWEEERLAFLCTEEGISNDWAGVFNDESVLDVLGGQFSCCTRNHPDDRPCDKQKIVGVMLGIFWRILATNRDAPHRKHARTLLRLVEKDEEKYFPKTASYRTELMEPRPIELFDGFLPILKEMFLEDSAAVQEERVNVPGVSDPWLTCSISLGPLPDEDPLASRNTQDFDQSIPSIHIVQPEATEVQIHEERI